VVSNVHTYCVVAKYDGSFLTTSGPSPQGTGTVGAGVTGTFQGGYSGVITGAFTPGTKRVKGRIGSKDYGCAINDSGAAVGCNYYDWIGDYFPGSSFGYTSWGWTYEAGNNGTWVNALARKTSALVLRESVVAGIMLRGASLFQNPLLLQITHALQLNS
jgi:hypothetical protein